MSKRRLSNLLKRKLFSKSSLPESLPSIGEDRWFKNQIKDLSRLGGTIIVMKAGN